MVHNAAPFVLRSSGILYLLNYTVYREDRLHNDCCEDPRKNHLLILKRQFVSVRDPRYVLMFYKFSSSFFVFFAPSLPQIRELPVVRTVELYIFLVGASR